MSDFTTEINGFRYIQTRYGDTLQTVALRELGDASAWSQLAWFNELVPPYLTDDIAQVKNGVVLNGGTIRIPAASAYVSADVSPDEVFLADIKLHNGELQVENGDFAIVSGLPNLHQAISGLIQTDHGDLLFHGEYGANLGRLKGALAGPSLEAVGAQYVEDALAAETRIQTVNSVTATVQGDRLSIESNVTPISGANVTFVKVA